MELFNASFFIERTANLQVYTSEKPIQILSTSEENKAGNYVPIKIIQKRMYLQIADRNIKRFSR